MVHFTIFALAILSFSVDGLTVVTIEPILISMMADFVCSSERVEDLNHASQLLPGGTIGSPEDAKIAKYACKIVLIRAALLTAICLSRIFVRFQKDDFTIVVKSPLLKKLPDFETYIRNFMEYLAPLKKFQIFIVEDDVCMEGAALATSIASRMRK